MFGVSGRSGEKTPVVPAAETVPLTVGMSVMLVLSKVAELIVWLNVAERDVLRDMPVALAAGVVELTVRGVVPAGCSGAVVCLLPSSPPPEQERREQKMNNAMTE